MKRSVCLLLAITTFMEIVIPSAAATSLEDNLKGSAVTSVEEKVDCDKYTITFDKPEILKITTDTNSKLNSDEVTKKVILEHNKNVTLEAKDFVLSLKLPEVNLEFIEASCLNELDEMSKFTDFVITSYTVLVPTGALKARERSVPFENLTYYGKYAGINFYFYYYSETGGTVNYKKTSKKANQWFNNLVDLVLCFADAEITVPITLVKQATGNPSAYCEYGFNVNIRTRGIYTKYTTLLPSPHTTYEEVYSGQIGHLYPGIVYYPVQSPQYA